MWSKKHSDDVENAVQCTGYTLRSASQEPSLPDPAEVDTQENTEPEFHPSLYGPSDELPPAKELRHELAVQDVCYTVKVWQGSWWKGCCLRQRQQKCVLNKVTAHMQSGQLTAILGNSGRPF